jgi:hypothetical protein
MGKTVSSKLPSRVVGNRENFTALMKPLHLMAIGAFHLKKARFHFARG